MSLFDPDRSAERLPVSLITGFLGSGKTTLLNRLVKQPALANAVVIVNELGEIGLDHLLVERIDGETVLLSGGCLCCAVRSDLESTLRDLLARRREGSLPPFARVLIETTGLADPAPIAQLLLNHPLVSGFFRLDGVVATVDAVHGGRQLDEHAEALKQVAIADRLLITKADLVASEEGALAGLRQRLGQANPGAPIALVTHGEIAPETLIDIGWSGAGTSAAASWLAAERYPASAAPEPQDHDHHPHPEAHPLSPRLSAFCLTRETPLDWLAFQAWLGDWRQRRGADLLRVKGILNISGESGPLVIHGIHHVFHPPVRLGQWPDADRRSRVVFVTRDLPATEILASWKDALGNEA